MTDAVMTDRERSRSPRRAPRAVDEIVRDTELAFLERHMRHIGEMNAAYTEQVASYLACVQKLEQRCVAGMDDLIRMNGVVSEQKRTIEALQRTITELGKDVESARRTLDSRPINS